MGRVVQSTGGPGSGLFMDSLDTHLSITDGFLCFYLSFGQDGREGAGDPELTFINSPEQRSSSTCEG